eukprot:TRINITY_DN63110_c0_g1_i1.p1 TRINITY_DN63110_c0_g1~~TRINITY_DN63110_c0_g1_i1.p1  ORF type:complete len:614 (-),score=163.07 TRINITY_DN63110_c0_g1_i1:91-1932(-)
MGKFLCAVGAAQLAVAGAWGGFQVVKGTTPAPVSYTPYAASAPVAPPTPSQMMGVPGAAVGAPPPGVDSTANLVAMSQKTANIIGGLTESFLGGSQAQLTPHELECLSSGASSLAGGMLDTAGRTAQSMKAFAAQAQAAKSLQQAQMSPRMAMRASQMQPQMSPQMAQAYPGMAQAPPGTYGATGAYGPTPPGAVPYGGSGLNPVDPLIAGLEITTRISRMMELENKVADKCLHQDAKDALKAAARHMHNMSYVGGHLISNGVDIMTELTKAVSAYEEGDYRAFGDNFGMAARKTLLSKEGEGLHGLLHAPTRAEIEEVTSSLVGSMFGHDMTLEVWTDPITTMAPPPAMYYMPPTAMPPLPNGTIVYANTQPPPAEVPWVLLPAADVKVDLHSCVQGNQKLFKTAWSPVFKVMSKMAQTSTADGMTMLEKGTATGAEGMGALAMSMLDMQIALRRCGFTAEQEAILWDAMEAGKGWHTKFHVPDDETEHENEQISKNMAHAVTEWKDRDYDQFGKRLGVALREMAITAFPEKYFVDSNGRLRRHLEEERLGSHGLTFGILGGCMLGLAALLAARGRRLALSLTGSRDDAALVRETECFVRAEAAEEGSFLAQ